MTTRRLFYYVIQFSWGLIQSLAGAAVFLVLIKREHFIYRGSIATVWKNRSSASIGAFIFISDSLSGGLKDDIVKHEFGHTIQSMILGPLYVPVISLPSMLWCMLPFLVKLRSRKKIDYYSFYTERWANRLGGTDISSL